MPPVDETYISLLMNRRILFQVVLAIIVQTSFAEGLTLQQCREMAQANYPAIRRYGMIEQSREFTVDNAAKGWLPKVSASAGAYAFTDILKANARMQQMGVEMENYVANASVIVSQSVYDGGQIAAQRRVASAQGEVEKRRLDVTMYAVTERVDDLFFGILVLDEQMAQNELLREDLTTSEATVRSMIRGGVASETDLDAILVEKLKADRQREALKSSRKAYRRMLGVFVGKDLPEGWKPEKPAETLAGKEWGVNRPEMRYYASQSLLLDARRKQLNARLRPTVSLFGMGMIHSLVSSALNSGVIVGGVSVSWNIGALYTRRNDIRLIDVERAMNNNQQETFLFNNRLQNEEAEGTVESLRRRIAQDEEIVRLRENIRRAGERKVQLGTESVSELVRDINAVSLARAEKALHEIELLKEIYRQKNLNND